ncbi:iron complex transport system permease protein [Microbacterium terrae]|uniref:Ferric enterobactin transport system permease protein FepD n=1 Tax=Microbacterium terrae TaxID=69369 RepID=A0A0M2H3I1_9MICO|nr:iron chelate uptake ABC transporter family permease subunit [Microbacterium terrae]KJL38087.1 Ferric enterobactin transport system permease protein FepD [Microbacterium terrae]MBP1077500.1 iron complex transport system permease protein [Microbacterium terrae]GLJ99105.1 iron ABC transporter [Microbacterium terrae]
MTDTIAALRRAPTTQVGARRRVAVLIFGLIAVVCSIVISLSFGSRGVSVEQVVEGIGAWFTGQTPTDIGALAVQSRIPRTVLALLAGAALALSGALMQAITRNPLADPGILGVNTGAALAVVIGIAFLGVSSALGYLGLALVGAFITAFFVYFVGSVGAGGTTPIKLALAGAATTAALSSLVAAILLPRQAVMDEFRYWQIGNVGRADWETMAVIVPVLVIGTIVALLCATGLNGLALGDDVATGLGVHVGRIRVIAAIAGVTLCAAVTSIAGPIGFVGLMVPHAVRQVAGPDQRWLLPLSAIGGAVLLTLADTIGRVLGSPGEVEAGIITAFLGAPVLIAIARRTRLKAM